jgi:hypothetical protein
LNCLNKNMSEQESRPAMSQFIRLSALVRLLRRGRWTRVTVCTPPASIKPDLQALYDLLAEARDAAGMVVLGVFPKLCHPILLRLKKLALEEAEDPELAPYLPRARHCSRSEFEARGWKGAIEQATRQ